MKKLILFCILLVVIPIAYAQVCHMRGCVGGGCGVGNTCPTVGQGTSWAFYYDASTAACNQVDCVEELECLPPGGVPLCEIPQVCCPSACPIVGCQGFIDPVCTYSVALHNPAVWGWWIRGDMPQETVPAVECSDDHDNDCDGLCDDTGCCINATFATEAACTAEIFDFCHENDFTTKKDCESIGYDWRYVNRIGYCDATWLNNAADCNDWCSGTLCTWESIPQQWLPCDPSCAGCSPVPAPSGNKLKFEQGNTGIYQAVIGSNGAMYIRGTDRGAAAMPAINGDDFVVRNNAGVPVVMLEGSTGDLYYGGAQATRTAVQLQAYIGGASDFLVTTQPGGQVVAAFTQTGDVFTLRGVADGENPV